MVIVAADTLALDPTSEMLELENPVTDSLKFTERLIGKLFVGSA